MVVPSKIFHPPLDINHCSQSILHPGVGCFHDFLTNIVKHSIGGFKYFSPLLITPLVLKFKTMNNELFVNTLKYYLKTVWWTTMASSASFYCICIFRNQFGRFRKYTTLFVPTVVGMQFCWLFPERVMKLFATATTQAVFEGLLRQYTNIFTQKLQHSRSVQTLIFMINSAIILHYKRLKVYREFWFMQPYTVVPHKDENANNVEADEKSKSKCVHGNAMTCSEFVWDGIRSYLLYGIPVDLLGVVMKSVPKGSGGGPQGIWPMVLAKLKSFRPNMTGFFIIYSGIYRLSSCLLHKYYGHRAINLQHLLAAFLGGSAYLSVDKASFFTLSTVIAIQALWQQFCNKRVASNNSKNLNSNTTNSKSKTSNLALRLLKDVEFSRIIFTLNMGYLIHNFIMNYEVLNAFTRGFLDALTANKTKHIRDTILKHTTEELMAIANTNTVKTFL